MAQGIAKTVKIAQPLTVSRQFAQVNKKPSPQQMEEFENLLNNMNLKMAAESKNARIEKVVESMLTI